ncbi:hypothetical protein EDD22DRAFT_881758 [Suillus occidentalis]|nr:hypothetical protein EDD22DRAFT_881758 [Suillus occidentalis]
MALSPPKYDGIMRPAFSLWSSPSKTRKNEVVVELSHTQPPPLFPMGLQNYVSPHMWETRVRAITRMASQYSKPVLERSWMLVAVILTFVAPIVAYYDFIGHFDNEQIDEDRQNQIVWQARLIALVVTVGLWVVMFLPIAIWKYMGRVRVNKMIDRWAKDDVRSASSYAAIPTWKVTMPGMFRDGIVLALELEYLPPYIAPPTDAAPSYEATKRLSGLQGDSKFGEIPLYNDAKETVA